MAARFFLALFLSVFIFQSRAFAQNDEPHYSIGDGASTQAVAPENDAPVRMAYFSFVSGDVLWRIDPESEKQIALSTPALNSADESESISDNNQWSRAGVNVPLRAGMEVLVKAGAKAEICFDDGSLVRLGGSSFLALETLSSNADSEFTALRLDGGLATLKLKHANSLFQLQAGSTSIRARGPGSVRVGASTPSDGSNVEIAVRGGRALVENEVGSITLRAGQFLKTQSGDQRFSVLRLPSPDSWEQWNLERDDFLQGDVLQGDSLQGDDGDDSKQDLPQNLSLVAGDLNRYGDWRDDAQHGRVWQPRVSVSTPHWRPYSLGSWNWFFPFGWTWVSSEPWGWAPYHYGTWINASYGWAWVPGPAWQPWCPGVVSFYERGGARCWAPLSPSEVRYPRYSRRASWLRCFSIFSAATYYPTTSFYCAPRAWSTPYANYAPCVNYITYVTKIKKVKKIVYLFPDERGKKIRRHEDKPEAAFDEVFERPSPGTSTPIALPVTAPKAKTEKTEKRAEDESQKWRSAFKDFVPRHARDDKTPNSPGWKLVNHNALNGGALAAPVPASPPNRTRVGDDKARDRQNPRENKVGENKVNENKPGEKKNAPQPSSSTRNAFDSSAPAPVNPPTLVNQNSVSDQAKAQRTQQEKAQQEKEKLEKQAREQAEQAARLQREQEKQIRDQQEKQARQQQENQQHEQERQANQRAQQEKQAREEQERIAKEREAKERQKRAEPTPPIASQPSPSPSTPPSQNNEENNRGAGGGKNRGRN